MMCPPGRQRERPNLWIQVHGMIKECNHYRALAVRRPQHLAGE